MKQFYLRSASSSKQTGPYTSDQIREMAATGRLRPADQLSADQRQWVTAEKVKGLAFPISPQMRAVRSTAGDGAAERVDSQPQSSRQTTSGSERPLDRNSIIGLGIGEIGLLMLAISPLFEWLSVGGGGLMGIAGSGKIVLAVSAYGIIALIVAVPIRLLVLITSLLAGAWGIVAMLWMGGIICKIAATMDSFGQEDDPLAALLAMQVTPGAGLYVGLIGGVITAGAMGYVATTQFRGEWRLWMLSAVYSGAVVLGLWIAVVGTLPHIV